MRTPKPLAILALAALLILLPACNTSRYAQLRARSDEIKDSLVAERDLAIRMQARRGLQADGDRKLNHVSSLRNTLTVVDIGLVATRRVLPEADRPLAYDAIEQAYDAIEWNIPLLPGQGTRPLPAAFTGGGFDVNQFLSAPAARTPAND